MLQQFYFPKYLTLREKTIKITWHQFQAFQILKHPRCNSAHKRAAARDISRHANRINGKDLLNIRTQMGTLN